MLCFLRRALRTIIDHSCFDKALHKLNFLLIISGQAINGNMDLGKKNILTCQFCNVDFSSTFNKNRHIKTKHSDQYSGSTLEQSKRTKHIICPICTNDETCFPFHKDLIKHLTSFHNITIKESTLYFRNFAEFTRWRAQENREVNYACRTRRTFPDGKEQKIYDCNRSDSKGFVSSAKKRNVKAGGSIRIRGTCPSRIVVNISANESVTTNFVETHVGHTDELRTKQLSKAEQSSQETRSHTESITFDDQREIMLEEVNSYACSLDEQSFKKFMINFRKFKRDTERQNAEENSKKRKIEKQMNPSKK